jgi:hypothetical protein
MRFTGHVESVEEIKSAYKIFVGKPERKRPLRRPRRRWEDNIDINMMEIRWKIWTHLAQDNGW